jgi:hypothetical protein
MCYRLHIFNWVKCEGIQNVINRFSAIIKSINCQRLMNLQAHIF